MRRRSLTKKIFVYFAFLIAVTLVVSSTAIYIKSSQQLDKRHEELLGQIVKNAVNHTDMYLKKFERTTLSFMTSPLLKQFLEWDTSSNTYQYSNLVKELKTNLLRPIMFSNPEVKVMYVVDYDGKVVSDQSVVGSYDNIIWNNLAYLEQNAHRDGKLTVLDYGIMSNSLSLARKVAVRQTSGDYKAIIGLELDVNELQSLWKGIQLGEQGYFMIFNNRGRIIYHPDNRKIGKQLDGELYTALITSKTPITYEQNKKKQVYYTEHSTVSGWTVAASMPLKEMRKPVTSIQKTTLVVGGFSLLIALFIAYRFGRSIVKPITLLEGAMSRTEQGVWTKVPLLGAGDERDRIIRRYNIMVMRLEELVERVYKSELENRELLLKRKTAEFQALQLQINPHFLYNTLETVVSYAIIQDSKEIREIIKSLSYMLRYALRTDLEKITVANELKHVLHYMTIMNYRFEQPMEIEVEVPTDHLLMKMVTLTLQPLVENAFQHAFPDGLEEHHSIKIITNIEGDLFVVKVVDNGVGIEITKLCKIKQMLLDGIKTENLLEEQAAFKESTSIGLLNVHNRIQIVFGMQYGLDLESKVGEGTIVSLYMPSGIGSNKNISI
ncbi:sensor histidine kinase [Paenibacillus yanchengensis]|uniref:Sensor histidine kinase n=1 Tax=Paenibacillus yanchengensis TaxID=2035833 RepID=A0ABW4YRD7_9BACL